MTIINALDVSLYSGDIQTYQWEQAKARGYDLAIVGAWHGAEANTYAQSTLGSAMSGGILVASYCALNDMDGRYAVMQALAACGEHTRYLKFMSLDVELKGVSSKILMDAINAVNDADVRPCIYTSRSKWSELMSNSTIASSGNIALWDANYNDGPTLKLAKPYGGWSASQVVGKQYQGSNTRLGFNADLSVFRKEWIDVA